MTSQLDDSDFGLGKWLILFCSTNLAQYIVYYLPNIVLYTTYPILYNIVYYLPWLASEDGLSFSPISDLLLCTFAYPYIQKETQNFIKLTQYHYTTKAEAHERYVLSKISFVTIGLSQLLSCAGDFSDDFGHSWHVSQTSNMFSLRNIFIYRAYKKKVIQLQRAIVR